MIVFLLAIVAEAAELLETLTIPCGGKTMIFSNAYRGWTNITDVVIEEDYEVIGLYAFADSSVERVTLPSTLKEIGEGAFQRSKLVSVVIPNGTATLGMFCFQYCSQLVHVELPETVSSIALGAFTPANKFRQMSKRGLFNWPNLCKTLFSLRFERSLREIDRMRPVNWVTRAKLSEELAKN